MNPLFRYSRCVCKGWCWKRVRNSKGIPDNMHWACTNLCRQPTPRSRIMYAGYIGDWDRVLGEL